MSKIASDYDVTIIFGAITSAPNNKKNNCIIAVYPDGSTSEEYVKQKLVPFGEKMPSFDIIGRIVPALTQLDIGTSYVEGTEGKIIETHEGIKTGPLVCYDSVFSSLARENVLKGAEIMVVSTNDSWYKDGAAVRQHQSQSVIRAIETGRYVFRSASTGISCIITSKGIITQETEILKEEYICGKGYASQRKTLFVLLGNTSLYFSFICVFSLFALKSLKKTKK
jgi:apolipoprotein N-acyltransferase